MLQWMSTHIQKISITEQFSLDILQIRYLELLLAFTRGPGHTNMPGLNQADVFMYA